MVADAALKPGARSLAKRGLEAIGSRIFNLPGGTESCGASPESSKVGGVSSD